MCGLGVVALAGPSMAAGQASLRRHSVRAEDGRIIAWTVQQVSANEPRVLIAGTPRVLWPACAERPRLEPEIHERRGSAVITIRLRFQEYEPAPGQIPPPCPPITRRPFARIRLKRAVVDLSVYDGSYSPPRLVRSAVKSRVPHARRSQSCGPAKAATLLAEPKARIYGAGGPNPLEPGRPERIYGCLVSTGHSIKLSPLPRTSRWGAPVMYGPFALDAPWAAGAVGQQTGRDSRENSISTRNLRSGQRKSCYVGGGHSPRASGGVTSIVLKRNGSFAWSGHSRIGEVTGGELPPPKVVACESTGQHVLDSGPGIDLHSLKLHGSKLTWTDAGEARSAVLH